MSSLHFFQRDKNVKTMSVYTENMWSGAVVTSTWLGLACQEVEGLYTGFTYLHRRWSEARSLIEHDGLWILVHHLRHVSQNILLGDDAQETPGQTHRGTQRSLQVIPQQRKRNDPHKFIYRSSSSLFILFYDQLNI